MHIASILIIAAFVAVRVGWRVLRARQRGGTP
jgi:hypothetical protein